MLSARPQKLHVLTSANLVPCPHQPLAAWAITKKQLTAFCLSLLPWLGPLVYRNAFCLSLLPWLGPLVYQDAACLSLLPWLGPLAYRDGVTLPEPGPPPERAGESTRTPLTSPEQLAQPCPARGASLASSLAGSFRGTGGQWGPLPRTSPCSPVWPTAFAYGLFASKKSKP